MESSIVPNIHINSQMSRIMVNIGLIGNNNILSSIRIMKSPFSLNTSYIKNIPNKKDIVYLMNFKW